MCGRISRVGVPSNKLKVNSNDKFVFSLHQHIFHVEIALNVNSFCVGFLILQGRITLKKACLCPHGYEIAFAIRDDDLSYFSDPRKIEAIYSQAWKMGFRISFAAIPMIRAVNNLNVPPTFRNDGEYYSIDRNKALVKYIKTKLSEDKVDIVQHGFCHTENLDLPALKFDFEKRTIHAFNSGKGTLSQFSEFYGKSEEECREKIRKGKEILEQTFDRKIKVFVAPQEYLSKNLWKALRKEGLCYCGGVYLSSVPIKNIKISAALAIVLQRLFKKTVFTKGICNLSDLPHLVPAYTHSWNKYLDESLSNYFFNKFKENFDVMLGDIFIVTTHHWEYFYDWRDEVTHIKQLEYLGRALSYVNKRNVWKCTLTELCKWLFEGNI
jgi:hypothetical protein